MSTARVRQAARALVLDELDNVLLLHFDWHGLEIPGGFWACPGGGINEDETAEDALRRELAEELGLVGAEISGAVWSLTRMFSMNAWDGQADTWYLVRTRHFTPQPRVELVLENVHGIRWFTPREINEGAVTFSPRDLGTQLNIVLAEGVPQQPRVIEAIA